MRLVLPFPIIVSLMLLSACSNLVVSDAPWFHADDADMKAILRDGIWISESADCKFDEAKRVERWPKCASWSYLRGGRGVSAQWNEEAAAKTPRWTYGNWSAPDGILVSGDPMIWQANDCSVTTENETHDGDPVTTLNSDGPSGAAQQPRICYYYVGARPVAFDGAGAITAAEAWFVTCGPLSKDEAKVTDRPWQGLVIVGNNCKATSKGALRDAAKQSREVALTGQAVTRMHWVRDGYR